MIRKKILITKNKLEKDITHAKKKKKKMVQAINSKKIYYI